MSADLVPVDVLVAVGTKMVTHYGVHLVGGIKVLTADFADALDLGLERSALLRRERVAEAYFARACG